jgi:hypothetical protein
VVSPGITGRIGAVGDHVHAPSRQLACGLRHPPPQGRRLVDETQHVEVVGHEHRFQEGEDRVERAGDIRGHPGCGLEPLGHPARQGLELGADDVAAPRVRRGMAAGAEVRPSSDRLGGS